MAQRNQEISVDQEEIQEGYLRQHGLNGRGLLMCSIRISEIFNFLKVSDEGLSMILRGMRQTGASSFRLIV